MSEKELVEKLSVIANLIAAQLIKDKDKGDSVWLLKQSGMSNKEIGPLLGISGDAVASYYSIKKKQMKYKSKKRGKKDD